MIPHGITGYRAYRCRCEQCSTAGEAYNAKRREAERNRKRTERKSVVIPEVDWSTLEHLKPGYGVSPRA